MSVWRFVKMLGIMWALALVISQLFWLTSAAQAQTYRTFYTFPATGATPRGDLVRDSLGNLYGTNWVGGKYGEGTVYKIDPSGKLTTLHNFTGGADGADPQSGLAMDAQ